jgi:hypothetical protein
MSVDGIHIWVDGVAYAIPANKTSKIVFTATTLKIFMLSSNVFLTQAKARLLTTFAPWCVFHIQIVSQKNVK